MIGSLDHHQLGYETNDALTLISWKSLLDRTAKTMCEASCKAAALDYMSGKKVKVLQTMQVESNSIRLHKAHTVEETFRKTLMLPLKKQKVTIDLDENNSQEKMQAEEKSLTNHLQYSGSLYKSACKRLQKHLNGPLVTNECVNNYSFLHQTPSTSPSHMSSKKSNKYFRMKSKDCEGLKKNYILFIPSSCVILHAIIV